MSWVGFMSKLFALYYVYHQSSGSDVFFCSNDDIYASDADNSHQVDRGGPLTVADSKSGAHTLVGAVSVGYGCTRAGEGAEGPTSMVIIIMMMIIIMMVIRLIVMIMVMLMMAVDAHCSVCATFEYSNMSKCVKLANLAVIKK